MATIDLGKIKLVWRGTYAGGTAYTVDDVVQHTDNGLTSSFICTTNSTGNAPSTGGSVHGSWAYLAKGGTAGTDVGTTLTTQGDVLYRDGSGLQRLAKGTAGQALLMNTAANAPEWGTMASDFVKITSQTLGSQTANWSLDGYFDSTKYKHYKIIGHNFEVLHNGGWIRAYFNVGGSASQAQDYSWTLASSYSSSLGNQSENGRTNGFIIVQNSTTSYKNGSFELLMYDVHNANVWKAFTLLSTGWDGSSARHSTAGGGHRNHTDVLTGITFTDNNGNNIAGGTVEIYGIKG